MWFNAQVRISAARSTSLCLVILLSSQAVLAAGQQESTSPARNAQQQAPPPTSAAAPAESSSSATMASDRLPDAPDPQSQPQSQDQQQPAQSTQQPVGTAAAPLERPTGVPGSRPSGAAIAPAKQRRVRAIVISFGIALAAGAAVGTVIGLSKASSSTPR